VDGILTFEHCGQASVYQITYIYTVESCTSSHMEVNMLMVSILLLKLQSQMSCSIFSSWTVNFSSTGS